MSRTVDWYFDFISPFAYLQQKRLQALPDSVTLRPQPVLLAGLLVHWGQKGPAEIPAKRIFTYQYAIWLGERLGVPLKMPPAHPFIPLRLAIALGNEMEFIGRIFDYIWRDGFSVDDVERWQSFTRDLGVRNAESLTSEQWVKDRLRRNTDSALAAGVFGVPTLACDDHLFWGHDATDMFLDYLQDPTLFNSPGMQDIEGLAIAADRLSR